MAAVCTAAAAEVRARRGSLTPVNLSKVRSAVAPQFYGDRGQGITSRSGTADPVFDGEEDQRGAGVEAERFHQLVFEELDRVGGAGELVSDFPGGAAFGQQLEDLTLAGESRMTGSPPGGGGWSIAWKTSPASAGVM